MFLAQRLSRQEPFILSDPAVSLPDALSHVAEAVPGAVGLYDRAGRHRTERAFTYAQLNRWAHAVAREIQRRALPVERPIALRIVSNRAEALVGLLGILRSGHDALVLPRFWFRYDLLRALLREEPVAMVLCSTDPSDPNAALSLAGDVFALRYLFAFGPPSDGFTPLPADIESARATSPTDPTADTGTDLRETSTPCGRTLHWIPERKGYRPLARDSGFWTHHGATLAARLALGTGPRIALPYHVLGYVGLMAGVGPWLSSHGALHLYSDVEQIHASGNESSAPDLAVLPHALSTMAPLHAGPAPRRVVRVHSEPPTRLPPRNWGGNEQQFDLVIIDDVAHVLVPSHPTGQPFLTGRALHAPGLVLTSSNPDEGGAGDLVLSGGLVAGRTRDPNGHPATTASSTYTSGYHIGRMRPTSDAPRTIRDRFARWRFGGMVVYADRIEAMLLDLAPVADACVLALPRPHNIPLLMALIVVVPGCDLPTLRQIRDHFRSAGLSPLYAPRIVVEVETLPSPDPGERDRAELLDIVLGGLETDFGPDTGSAAHVSLDMGTMPRQPMPGP